MPKPPEPIHKPQGADSSMFEHLVKSYFRHHYEEFFQEDTLYDLRTVGAIRSMTSKSFNGEYSYESQPSIDLSKLSHTNGLRARAAIGKRLEYLVENEKCDVVISKSRLVLSLLRHSSRPCIHFSLATAPENRALYRGVKGLIVADVVGTGVSLSRSIAQLCFSGIQVESAISVVDLVSRSALDVRPRLYKTLVCIDVDRHPTEFSNDYDESEVRNVLGEDPESPVAVGS